MQREGLLHLQGDRESHSTREGGHMKSSRFNVQGSRFKERLKTAGGILLVVVCLCAFWIFLFQGIIAEQDRRLATVPMQQPELVKAMQAVSK